MQEMEKCSLNPGLVFLLLERRKEKKKGKERGTQGKCTWGECRAGQGRDRSLLKGRRIIKNQLEGQGEPEWARGAARRARAAFTYGPGQLGREVFTPGHSNCHNTMQLAANVEK